MQRFYLKTLLAVFIFTIIFALPVSANTHIRINSNLNNKQNNSFEKETDSQSVKIQVKINGEDVANTSLSIPNSKNNQNLTPTESKKIEPTLTNTQERNETNKKTEQKAIVRNTPTPTIKNKLSPTQVINSNIEDNKKAFIMDEINKYRKSHKLQSVQTSSETCAFAKTRAYEISKSFNHDGFRKRINSKSLPYTSWSLVTENIAMTSNYKNVVNMWIASSSHAANLSKDTPYICVENYANYYAYEGMKP